MPTTIQPYNHTLTRFNTGLNLQANTYKMMLLNNDAVFDATDTTLVEVAGVDNANEIFGNGWTEGGETLANVVAAVYDTNGFKFDADNLSVELTDELGPIYKFVVYNDTAADDPPVLFGTHSTAITVPAGNNAGAIWPADGIIVWTVT